MNWKTQLNGQTGMSYVMRIDRTILFSDIPRNQTLETMKWNEYEDIASFLKKNYVRELCIVILYEQTHFI